MLAATAVTQGPFLAGGGTTFFGPGVIDNGAGLIRATADTLVGAGPGVSGDGVLATISFRALVSGISPVTLSSVTLLDSRLREIPVNSASVTIVPEPNPFSLLALGAVLGWCWRKGPWTLHGD